MAGGRANLHLAALTTLAAISLFLAAHGADGTGIWSVDNQLNSDVDIVCFSDNIDLDPLFLRRHQMMGHSFDVHAARYWNCAVMSLNETTRHSKTWMLWSTLDTPGDENPIVDWEMNELGLWIKNRATQSWLFKFPWDLI